MLCIIMPVPQHENYNVKDMPIADAVQKGL